MSIVNERIPSAQPAIACGGSLLLSVLLTQLLFRVGISVTPWHFLLLPGTFVLLLCTGFLLEGRASARGILHECGIGLAVLAAFLLLTGWTIATDFDGLFMHVEFVRALSLGWNPVRDPFLLQPELLGSGPSIELLQSKIEAGGYYLKYGQILQALPAAAFGLEYGKAANAWFAYFLFRSAAYVLQRWGRGRLESVLLAALVTLNPVIVYQIPSFKHDGLVACLLAIVILSGIVFLKHPRRDILILALIAMTLLVGVKKSGLAYASFFLAAYAGLFAVFQLPFILKHAWQFLLGVAVLVVIAVVVLKSGAWDIRPDIQLPIAEALQSRGNLVDRIKPESVFDHYPEYREMQGFEQFLTTIFSETHISPSTPVWKVPGTFSSREIANYLQAFTGYWIGGLGPFFSLAVTLSMCGTLLAVLLNASNAKWLLAMLVPLLLTVSLLPSLCVRWVPHIWLLGILWIVAMPPRAVDPGVKGALFSLLSLHDWMRVMVLLANWTLWVNALLVLGLTVIGQVRIRQILETQFALLEQVEQPLSVSFDWFPSNRFWFEDRGIAINIRLQDEFRGEVPYSNLYRTNTRVHLTSESLAQWVRYPKSDELMELQKGLEYLERKLPSDAYQWHWIRPLLVLPGDALL
ncbi:MAG: hypothetical protein ABQ298_10825 [Puniceicoccaceae bacterium]